MQILKKMEAKANKKLTHSTLRKKVVVFYKQKTVKRFQFLKKIHRFVGDALVTGTKLKLSFFQYLT